MRGIFTLTIAIGMSACGTTETSMPKDGGGDGGTDSSAGDGSGGDASMNDGSPSDSGNDTGTGDSGECWTNCYSCLTMQCSGELATCMGNTACKAAFPALEVCSKACMSGCDNTFEVVDKTAKDLIDCGANRCQSCADVLGW